MALYCPQCGRRYFSGATTCLEEGAALAPDPRLQRAFGAIRLQRFVGEHRLGSLYRQAGAPDEDFLVFEGDAIDPRADFEACVAELEKLQGADFTHIVRALAVGELQGLRFRVTPGLEGEPLAAAIEELEGPLPLPRALAVIVGVADALAEAHGRGVVHGALSPEVIWLQDGPVLVEDFGVARLLRPERLVGPPDGDPLEPSAADDVWALGAVAWWVLTGGPPPAERVSLATLDPTLPLAVRETVDAMVGPRPGRPTAAAVAGMLRGERALRSRLTAEVVAAPPPPTPAPALAPAPAAPAAPAPAAVAPAPSRRGLALGAALALAGVLALVLWPRAPVAPAADAGPPPPDAGAPPPAPDAALATTGRVLRVEPEGELRTLAAAVAEARPGDRVIVPAGVHPGPIELGVPLILEGEPGAIIDGADENALRIAADAVVRRVTLRRTGLRNRYVVRVRAGHARLEDCTIMGAGGAAVGVTDEGRLTIQGGRIQGGQAAGLFVTDLGQAILADCEIQDAGLSGVEVAGQGRVRARRCQIHDNAGAGVLAREAGHVDLDGVEVFSNDNAGLSIKDSASGRVVRSLFREGRASGLFVRSRGEVRVEDSRFVQNRLAGVEIGDRATPVLRRNTLSGGLGTGIFIHDDAKPRIEGNVLQGQALAAIEVTTRAEPVLRGNRIEGGDGGGIFLHDQAGGLVEDNEIVGTARASVLVRDPGTAPRVVRNVLRGGGQSGLHVLQGAAGTYTENRITDHRGHGIEVVAAAPSLEGNTVRGNAGYGVAYFEAAAGRLGHNALEGNAAGTLRLEGADPARLERADGPTP